MTRRDLGVTEDFNHNAELIKTMTDIDIEVPTKLELFDYQKVGAFYMWYVKKCFMLDDTGLGKTAQVLGYCKLLQKSKFKSNPNEPLKVLIVVTSSILFQWKSEVEKFTDLHCDVADQKSKKDRDRHYEKFAKNNMQILIINYHKILKDYEQISQLNFDAVVFDEASQLKENNTKMYKLFKTICDRTPRVVLLTATPISNNLEEFYNLFELFNMPGILPDRNEFIATYLVTKKVKVKTRWGEKMIDTISGSRLDMIPVFKNLISPFFIRRLNTDDDSELSKLKMNIIQVPVLPTKEQKDLCNALKVDQATNDTPIISLYTDFVKVSCCPQIYSNDFSNISPKAIRLIEFLQSTDRKVVLFAKFIEFHKIMQQYLDKAGIKYCCINGTLSAKDRQKSKSDFENDPEIKVIMLTGAGKFGLNLQITNQLVFTDIPYTPSDVFQIIGRVFRTGQTEDVDIRFIYCQDSLEEDLFGVLERKQREIDTFFDQDKAEIFSLTRNSIKVNVKKNFMTRDYLHGPYFELSPEQYDLIPEKEYIEIQKPSESVEAIAEFAGAVESVFDGNKVIL